MESLQGHLLVSSPALVDPNFRRTVVLIAHHDEDGAMGLVLTRPSDVKVVDAVPALEGVVEDEAVARVIGDVGFMPAEAEPDELAVRRMRVFAGYAGWGAGQLEAELEEP